MARLKNQFFSDKDFFGRLPLHYLFYNLKQFDINTFSTANIYSLKNFYSNNGNDKLTPIYFGNNAECNQIPVIDSVELLTILLNNTERKILRRERHLWLYAIALRLYAWLYDFVLAIGLEGLQHFEQVINFEFWRF